MGRRLWKVEDKLLSFAGGGALRLAATLTIIWVAWRLVWMAGTEWRRAAFTRWWDPSSHADAALTWPEVLRLVRFDGASDARGTDPLDFAPIVRSIRTTIFSAVRIGVPLLALASLSASALSFAIRPFIPAIFAYAGDAPANANAAINLSGNLTALLALVAASISIAFTYHQLRAKVRADNRQEWLGRVRTTLAQTIALATEHANLDDTDPRRSDVWMKLNPARLELELLLNPSEKDHRLLMYLVQRLAFAGREGFVDIADAGELVRSIKASLSETQVSNGSNNNEASDSVARTYEVDWAPITETRDVATLVGYAMRLSHVVLKREWERVKWTR
jgi:hypothetical protein